VGGHAYGWVYSGPIGAVITPLLSGLENATPLPFASTLCGMCKEVCPVDIDIPRMLLELRRDMVEMGKGGKVWDLAMRAWAYGFRSPGRFGLGGRVAAATTQTVKPRNLPGLFAGWTAYRTLPTFARTSFRRRWQKRNGHTP
jgi:L-lactate dehydrogenase complex protein LldF